MARTPKIEWAECPHCRKRYDAGSAYAAAMHRGKKCVIDLMEALQRSLAEEPRRRTTESDAARAAAPEEVEDE